MGYGGAKDMDVGRVAKRVGEGKGFCRPLLLVRKLSPRGVISFVIPKWNLAVRSFVDRRGK